VKDPRVLRFDPASRAIWSLAVLPDAAKGKAMTAVELTNWADQVLKKRLENVRGVGSVTLVGGSKREINLYLNPQAMEALGVTADQVVARCATRTRTCRWAPSARWRRNAWCRSTPAWSGPRTSARSSWRARAAAPVRVDQVARVSDGAQEVDSLALYNGQRTLLLSVQKAQDENTIAVIDGLKQTLAEMQAQLPPGVRLEPVQDSSRPIRVAVENVRRTLIEGALLTVLIVFLFLNSWRSTVITGLTLPIALIGTFLFMNMFGFTVNMVTLMALSLCVGLLIDDAIVVRENIVRHVQMGKGAYQASLDGTQEIGLAVLATTLSIVAVFLPIGFMGGIIGKFFHEFGVTIVAAVLISMFVSFTLDPMLSSIWHDPAIESHGKDAAARAPFYDKHHRPRHRLVRPRHRAPERGLPGHAALVAGPQAGHAGAGAGHLHHQRLHGAAAGHRVRAQGRLLGNLAQLLHAGGLVAGKHRSQGAPGRGHPARDARGEATRWPPSTPATRQGKMYASVYVRLVDRKARTRSVDEMSGVLRERLKQVPGITVTHVGLLDSVGGNKQVEFSLQGPDLRELERLTRVITARSGPSPAWSTWTPASRPTSR
jgi:HAE1 family hydrophobic/amphiphilic exporter-1